MPRDVHRGINSVKRFVRQHRIEGVHGTLIELIDCLPQLYTAVEVRPLSSSNLGCWIFMVIQRLSSCTVCPCSIPPLRSHPPSGNLRG